MDDSQRWICDFSDPGKLPVARTYKKLDWSVILKFTASHGIAPLIHYNLKRSACEVPDKIARYFEECYLKSLIQYEKYLDTLDELLNFTQKDKLQFILLKGIALGYTLYPQPEIRPICDMDIFIRKEDYPKWRENLIYKEYILDSRYNEEVSQCEGQVRFINYRLKRMIQLHWEFVRSNSLKQVLEQEINLNQIWNNIEKIHILHYDLYTLSKETQFIYLCIHQAYHHQFARLIWLIDILQMLRNHIYLEIIEKLVPKMKISNPTKIPIYYTLYFIKDIYNITNLDGILEDLTPLPLKTNLFCNILSTKDILKAENPIIKCKRKFFREGLKVKYIS